VDLRHLGRRRPRGGSGDRDVGGGRRRPGGGEDGRRGAGFDGELVE